MIIELFDDYYIDCDGLNYSLMKRVAGKTKDGDDREGNKIVGHYTTLAGALKRCALEMVYSENKGNVITVQDYIESVVKATDKLEKIVNVL